MPRPSHVLLGVTAAVVVLALAPHPGASVAAPPAVRSVPVNDATLVCPQAAGRDATTVSVLTAASPGTGGTLAVRALGAPASARPIARAVGTQHQLTVVPGKGKPPVLVVRATGERARGLTASVLTRASGGRARSLHTALCTEPTGDTWLVGGSTLATRRDSVYLTNADAAAAVVDVTVFGAEGANNPESAQGVTVAPGTQVVLPLDALAPGLVSTVVQVHARSGRVAAALGATAAIGLVPAGVDWVPASAAPQRHPVVVGIPSDADTRRLLLLLVPGQQDAQVRVRFATPDGTLSPQGLDSLAVPAGRVFPVDLGKAGVSGPFSLLVDSDQPLVAGVWSQRGSRGQLTDFSYSAGAAPVVGDAVGGDAVVLPHADRSPIVNTVLQLTAPRDDVVVRITPRDATGADLSPMQVKVTGGRMVEVPIGLVGQADATVLVEAPAGSGLVVSWVLSEQGPRGPLVTGGPVPQTALTVPLPPVVADPAAGFAGH